MSSRKGRPPVGGGGTRGVPITTLLPQGVIEEIAAIASEQGRTRSAVARDLLIEGAACYRGSTESTPPNTSMSEFPDAATLIAGWIERSRAKFARYANAAANAGPLLQVMLEAATELPEGAPPPITTSMVMTLADEKNWHARGRLFFEVLAEMRRREITLDPEPEGANT